MCNNLKELLEYEHNIIDKFIKERQPTSHEERQKVVSYFIMNNAGRMRKTFCTEICAEKGSCKLLSENVALIT